MKIAGLGNVAQLAYVPRDVDAALDYWTRTMGVGPFFAVEHIKLVRSEYLGKPSAFDVTAYWAYWGDMQIELVRQHNDAPSMYKSWLAEGREGLQHVCVMVDDWEEARGVIAKSGARVIQEGEAVGGAKFLYADFGNDLGPVVEISLRSPAFDELFATMRRAAQGWNGNDPVRTLKL